MRYNTNKKGYKLSKITLDVDKQDLDTVLTILDNLKAGLINKVTVDNKIISSSIQNKKVTQKRPVLEDEFMSAAPTNSKYSKAAYKQRLVKK